MNRSPLNALIVAALLGGLPSPSVAATEIHLWHAMAAGLGERVNELAARFNASQSDYVVRAVHKGSYVQTLNAAIAAHRAKQPPHIVQVFERGTQAWLSSGAVYPVHQLMKDHAVAIDWRDLFGPLRSFYSTGGSVDALAFNPSIPILYYNKDLFKKAGLPDLAPTTWDEVEAMAKALKAAGVKCPFASAFPAWVLLENMHAYHDQPFSDRSNGFDGLATALTINRPFGVRMMEVLARGAQESWFTYGGRLNKAEGLMSAGECGIFTTASVYVGTLTRVADGKFAWGTGLLPRFAGYPQGDSLLGGAALWVMTGATPEEYRGVAQFLRYVTSTGHQAWWAEMTGFLPLTNAAAGAMAASGHYTKNPHQKTAVDQMSRGRTTPNSQGLRLGNSVAVRDVIEEQMEHIFSGKKTPQQGLDDAVARGNEILKDFAALNK